MPITINSTSSSAAAKKIKTVANVCGEDLARFLSNSARVPLESDVHGYSLERANQALLDLRRMKKRGAKVTRIW